MKTGSSYASIPNPTPVLFLITAIALLVWPDAAAKTTVAISGAVLLPIAVIVLARSPKAAIVALVAASAAPRLFIEILGLRARPEHLVSVLLLCLVPFIWKRREQPIQWTDPDYWLMAYVGMNLFSSLFMSTAPAQTIKWAMQQVLAILPYFLLRLLIADRERFRWAFRASLVIGAMASAYAITCFYSNRFLGTNFGVDLTQYVTVPATYGVQFEPNILGAYSGALAVMMMALYFYERRQVYLIGSAFVGMIGMAISLSRAALAATLVGVWVLGWFGLKRRLVDWKLARSVIIVMVCAAAIVLPSVFGYYMERFSTFDLGDPTADPNTLSRAMQTYIAIDEIGRHPVLGGGTASFQLAFDWKEFGTGWEDEGWIGNTELRVLHDTGAVGLAIFVGFIASLLRLAWKILKRESSPELVALLAAGLVYVITFQATEGTLLAFSWVHFGLAGCAVSIMSSHAKNNNHPEEPVST